MHQEALKSQTALLTVNRAVQWPLSGVAHSLFSDAGYWLRPNHHMQSVPSSRQRLRASTLDADNMDFILSKLADFVHNADMHLLGGLQTQTSGTSRPCCTWRHLCASHGTLFLKWCAPTLLGPSF